MGDARSTLTASVAYASRISLTDEQSAVDEIWRTFDDALCAGNMHDVNEAIRAIDVLATSPIVLHSVLTVTCPAQDALHSWRTLFKRTHDRFVMLGIDADGELHGLRKDERKRRC